MGNNRHPRKHGTISEYSNHGCNKREDCPNFGTEQPTCSDAWAEYYRIKRGGSAPKRRGAFNMPPSTNNRTPGQTEKNDMGWTKPGDDSTAKMMRTLWGPAEDSGDRAN